VGWRRRRVTHRLGFLREQTAGYGASRLTHPTHRLFYRDRLLTFVTVPITCRSSRSRRDLSRGYFRKWNGSGSCARRYDPRPGGLGIALAGTMTGLRGAPLDWDSARRVTPARGTSQETRPRLSHGIHLRGKRRGGAPKGERARSADGWQRSFRVARAASVDAALSTRLSALRLPPSFWREVLGRAFLPWRGPTRMRSRIARTRFFASAPAKAGEGDRP
jgi:hypothetical protein